MRQSQARRLVLTLDACHTGVEIGRELADPEFLRNAYELAEGFALLAASTAQGVAQEWQAGEHGVFTYYLLDGLSGQADRDRKGFVTVDDLRKHVVDGLRRWYVEQRGLIQEPTARTEGLGDMILADHLTEKAVSPPVRTARLPFEPELVTVPAGPFLMGTSDQQIAYMVRRFEWAKEDQKAGRFDHEQPQHEVELSTFEIGRYPVTNAEYNAFVDATFHDAPDYWDGGRYPQQLASHPVVNVTWHDAQAYAAWLREQTGRPYCLPAEAEWEKAARGTDGRLWPWGNEPPDKRRCNLSSQVGETTPVGKYSPHGDSPYGCADMAGNVWEWTQTLWGGDLFFAQFSYPYDPDDGRENPRASENLLRILRGGGFNNEEAGTRCAGRGWILPSTRREDTGFRVVVAPLDL
jgi:formylglycine-generating enzyme required for sulfatase activity